MINWLKKVLPAPENAGRANSTVVPCDGSLLTDGLPNKYATHKKRGNEFLAKGMLEEAAECYRQAVAVNPGSAEGFLNLGFVLREQKLYEDAERYLKQAVLINPALEDAYYLVGGIAQERGNLAGAIENYSKTLELKPDFEMAYGDLCHALFQSGQIERAKKVIKQGLSLNPESAEFHCYLGNLYVYEKKLEKAIACYQKALLIQPNYAEVHGLLGNAFKARGNLDEAQACYRKALALNPDDADVHNKLGTVFQDLGNLDEAQACYRKALALNPDFVDAHNNLGTAFQDRGNLDEAQACYRKALALNPDFVDAHNNLGVLFQAMSNFDEAVACYRKALALKPDSVEANNNLGGVFQAMGNFDEAVACYRKALALKPDSVEANNNLGGIYKKQGNLDEAAACYRKALAANPDDADVHNNLGTVFQELGDLDDAQACYCRAIALNPDCVDAHNNLGVVFRKQGNLDKAVACYRKALALKPDFPATYNNLGNALRDQGNLDEAVACYRKALTLNPDDADVHNNLGAVFQDRVDLDEAAACYNKALMLQPDLSKALNNLGIVFQDQSKLDRALTCFQQALESTPEFPAAKFNLLHVKQHVCDWKDFESLSAEIRRGVRETPPTTDNLIPPFSFLTLAGTTPPEQRLCANNWAQGVYKSQISKRKEMGFVFTREPKPKIHIGYFSADFRNHPVAYLMAEIFELHDRDRFQISAYSYGPDDGGVMRRRLEKAFDHFVDIRDLTHENAARKIYEDHVDILVDLTGYTKYTRSATLALRPAPVQVGYLGYLGTMGGDFMDYIIADAFLIPPEYKKYYSEKVAYLPSYQANDRRCAVAETPTRKSCGLPEEAVVFCCFNQSYKILPDVFDIWMRLLKAVPGSVFWVYASNPYAIANLQREAQTRGVTPERLIFAETLPLDKHLARLKCADLFLDTLPYNAGTTASNALWAGLPVITCAGETFSSRMAGSLLIAMGVPELITHNLEDYFALALELATNRIKYEAVRNKIISNRESALLFDSTKFTRNLESVYLQMWDAYVNSPPSD